MPRFADRLANGKSNIRVDRHVQGCFGGKNRNIRLCFARSCLLLAIVLVEFNCVLASPAPQRRRYDHGEEPCRLERHPLQ